MLQASGIGARRGVAAVAAGGSGKQQTYGSSELAGAGSRQKKNTHHTVMVTVTILRIWLHVF